MSNPSVPQFDGEMTSLVIESRQPAGAARPGGSRRRQAVPGADPRAGSRRTGLVEAASDAQIKMAIRLHGRALPQLEITRLLLIESPPRCYPATAVWAQALHQQYDQVDGLAWKSRKLDDQDSYLLFGDRVKTATLAAAALSAALNVDPGLRSAVVQEALAVYVLTNVSE